MKSILRVIVYALILSGVSACNRGYDVQSIQEFNRVNQQFKDAVDIDQPDEKIDLRKRRISMHMTRHIIWRD
jgi:hypothetical protein